MPQRLSFSDRNACQIGAAGCPDLCRQHAWHLAWKGSRYTMLLHTAFTTTSCGVCYLKQSSFTFGFMLLYASMGTILLFCTRSPPDATRAAQQIEALKSAIKTCADAAGLQCNEASGRCSSFTHLPGCI